MKFVLIFMLSLFLNACTSSAGTSNTRQHTAEYSASQLVGAWELIFDGRYPYWFSQIGFTESGRKCVLSYEFDSTGAVAMTYYANHFSIKEGLLITDVSYSSTEYVPAGTVIKDRIESVSTNRFEVFMVEPFVGSTPEIHQRLIDVDPNEICKIVDDFQIAQSESMTSA